MDKNNEGILNGLKYMLGVLKDNTTPNQQNELDEIERNINHIEDLNHKKKLKYADLPNGNHEADYTMIYALLSALEQNSKKRIPDKYWEFLKSHKLDVEIAIENPTPEFVSANIAIVYREFIVSADERAKLLRQHALKLFVEKMNSVTMLIEQNSEMKGVIISFRDMIEAANQIDGSEYIYYTDKYIDNMAPSLKQYVLTCITQAESESKKFRGCFL